LGRAVARLEKLRKSGVPLSQGIAALSQEVETRLSASGPI